MHQIIWSKFNYLPCSFVYYVYHTKNIKPLLTWISKTSVSACKKNISVHCGLVDRTDGVDKLESSAVWLAAQKCSVLRVWPIISQMVLCCKPLRILIWIPLLFKTWITGYDLQAPQRAIRSVFLGKCSVIKFLLLFRNNAFVYLYFDSFSIINL